MRTTILMLAILLAGAAAPRPALAATGSLPALLERYEEARQALVADSLEGVARPAREMAQTARELGRKLTAESAGTAATSLPQVREALPAVTDAADDLAAAPDLEAARAAFHALTEALLPWWQEAGAGGFAKAFCPMAGKAWLQPAGEEIGNPFYGQSMARCGSLESR